MPTEQEMLPKDKYTIFDRKEKKYRKGIHSKFACFAGYALKKLIICRASKMDKIVATTQPTRLLI
jgi:hypothetical protein